MKKYRGTREPGGGAGQVVIVDVEGERPLPHAMLHSPDGFQWGYHGSGPADLARSICQDCLGYVPSPAVYQQVKDQLVATIQTDSFELPASRVMDEIAKATKLAGRVE